MYMYKTGAELKEYVKSSRVCGYKSRDFVQRVVDYCESDENYHKLYGVCGLRSLGKTVGLLQAIEKINKYNESAYISFNRDSESSIYLLYKILNSLPDEINYIFIDEITSLKDFVPALGLLCDKFIFEGKK